ncbi:MAG: hypothetical protein ABEJ65_00560 [bacterium]
MADDTGELSTEELVDRFDQGEDLVDYEKDLTMMDSASGPMEVSSIRLPKVFLRAMDILETESTGRSSIIRSAIFQWLKENNPDALMQAQEEIKADIEQEGKKASA